EDCLEKDLGRGVSGERRGQVKKNVSNYDSSLPLLLSSGNMATYLGDYETLSMACAGWYGFPSHG
ncbi:hypothetical protein HAX54_009071, partial [Datura stramonium]|nr:hypothetical protein [Datura stramonium]